MPRGGAGALAGGTGPGCLAAVRRRCGSLFCGVGLVSVVRGRSGFLRCGAGAGSCGAGLVRFPRCGVWRAFPRCGGRGGFRDSGPVVLSARAGPDCPPAARGRLDFPQGAQPTASSSVAGSALFTRERRPSPHPCRAVGRLPACREQSVPGHSPVRGRVRTGAPHRCPAPRSPNGVDRPPSPSAAGPTGEGTEPRVAPWSAAPLTAGSVRGLPRLVGCVGRSGSVVPGPVAVGPGLSCRVLVGLVSGLSCRVLAAAGSRGVLPGSGDCWSGSVVSGFRRRLRLGDGASNSGVGRGFAGVVSRGGFGAGARMWRGRWGWRCDGGVRGGAAVGFVGRSADVVVPAGGVRSVERSGGMREPPWSGRVGTPGSGPVDGGGAGLRRVPAARFAADAASLRCGVSRGRVGRAEGEGAGDEFRRTCS